MRISFPEAEDLFSWFGGFFRVILMDSVPGFVDGDEDGADGATSR